LRDSGVDVTVANRADSYIDSVKEDGFSMLSLDHIADKCDVILLLVPDQAHSEIYERYIRDKIAEGGLFVVAHGYSLRFQLLDLSDRHDVVMLAPRMPGKHVRSYYLENKGVPAFVDVIQNSSDTALDQVLSLSKAVGFTRSGVLQVDYKVETELDLFIEQYIVPTIIKSIVLAYRELTETHGYPSMASLFELYASGEIGEVLISASDRGIGKVFQENASPTCQFGISQNFDSVLPGDQQEIISDVIEKIKSGVFSDALQKEGEIEYSNVSKFWQSIDSVVQNTQNQIQESFKR
jgi:ketol-acid reductoisomerase